MAIDYGEPTLLTTTDTELEANMLLAMLREQGIPAFTKSRGAGGYLSIYMNAAYMGIEIYVPLQMLVQAEKLTALWLAAGEETAAPDLDKPEPLPPQRRGRLVVWLFLAYLVLSLTLGYCSALGEIIRDVLL